MFKVCSIAEVKFELIRKISGEGKNSESYLARDLQLNAEIFVKKISKTNLDAGRYFNEASCLYLSLHQNVAKIIYACQDEDFIYIFMPLYPLGSVKSYFANRALKVRDILKIGLDVSLALQHIHSVGLIHFDIKPDNILLDSYSNYVLTDFGQTKEMNSSGLAYQDMIYNLMLPPEYAPNIGFDVRFDIYQFGLTLYRLCINDQKFYGSFAKFVDSRGYLALLDLKIAQYAGNFPDRSLFPVHIPRALRDVINRCLMPNVAHRYQSILEVQNGLALINGNMLDWEYSENGMERKWVKNVNGRITILRVRHDGVSEMTCSINGGNFRKINAGFRANISNREIYSLLNNY